jgi:DNA mismatch repair protein MutS
MRRQYLEIKAMHRDAIVLFRLGDFYEAFDDDAKLLAKELDIVLTSRDMGRGLRVPLAGVPAHSLETHIARMVKNGHNVAICEQLGDPATTKGLLPREVVRVVTPGTVSDPAMLAAAENNYLACLVVEQEQGGIAYCDVTTGEFRVTHVEGKDVRQRLIAELRRLRVAELLVAATDDLALVRTSVSSPGREQALGEQQTIGSAIAILDERASRVDECRRALLALFAVTTLSAFGIEHQPCATCAAGGIVLYLQGRQKQSLAGIEALTSYSLDSFMQLDDETVHSLELWSSASSTRRGDDKHTLLDVIDRTRTPMGARLLRKWVAQPLLDVAAIQERNQLIGTFVIDTQARQTLRALLSRIPDFERLTVRITQGSASPNDLATLRAGLGVLPDIHKVLQATSSGQVGVFSTELPLCQRERALLSEALVEDPPPTLGDNRAIKPGFRVDLDDVEASAAEARAWVAGLESAERLRTGIRSLKVGYNRVFGYYLEVSNANKADLPEHYLRRQTLSGAERYVTSDLKEREATILGAQERFTRLEREVFSDLLDSLSQARHELAQAALTLARLDVLSALADVAAFRRYCQPEIHAGDDIKITAGRHPTVESALPPGAIIPNDTKLSNDRQQIIVLTGPNMAGKSTYLRQVALIVLLAQIGSWVPAESATIGVVDRIFTRVGARDDVARGRSTFMVEMLELAHILNQATANSLIVLDEVGRGTSTYDGLAIARSTLEFLHNAPRLGAKTLFASHYHELIELASVLPRVVNYNVAVSEEGEHVVFQHKIVPGGADRSYGIHVARLAGVPRAVTRRADEILRELERGKVKSRVGQSRRFSELQLSLTDESHPQKQEDGVVKELAELDLLSLSPLEALTRMFELQKRAREVR